MTSDTRRTLLRVVLLATAGFLVFVLPFMFDLWPATRGGVTRKPATVTYETARRLALALPGVEEGTSYGTPAFRVTGKLLARLREDGDSLVVKTDFDEREMLMRADPATFYITEHYRNYPAVLVRLSSVGRDELHDLLEQAWRRTAPRRLVASFDAERAALSPLGGGRSRPRTGPGRTDRRAPRAEGSHRAP